MGNAGICPNCYALLEPSVEHFKIGTLRVCSLYKYKEKLKELIYQFKGCGDIELSDVFIGRQAALLRLLYAGRTVVPAPSFLSRDEARGFNHVIEMFEGLNMPMQPVLRKTKNIKQADQSYEERQSIGKVIECVDSKKIKDKNILLVDDLCTTGSTLRSCADLLLRNGAKSVTALVIAKAEKEDSA